jgi:transcriptional regulator with XRE-family HTH domain
MDIFKAYRVSLARNIKRTRKMKGISAESMAFILKMSEGNYYRLESGGQSVKGEWLAAIASHLEVDIDYLFGPAEKSRKTDGMEKDILSYCRLFDEERMQDVATLIATLYRNNVSCEQLKALQGLLKTMN